MHNQASLITILRFIKPSRHSIHRLYYGYNHFRGFVTSVLLLFLSTTSAISQETSTGFTFEVNRVDISAKGTTLIGPIKLELAPWHADALSGSMFSNQDCSNLYTFSELTLTDHRQQWSHIRSATYCAQSHRLDIEALRLQLGDLHLSVAHLKATYPSSKPLHLSDATLSCGRLMPLSLNAKSGKLTPEQIILQDITLKVGAVPLGWFPFLNVSKSGRAGLLPPRLSIQADEVRVGVPVYIPLSPSQDLTIAPGIGLEPSSHHLFSRADYRWSQPSGIPGSLSLLGAHRFLSAHALGHARIGQWHITTHGHTRFGAGVMSMDPNLSVEDLSGFSRGQVALSWRHQNLSWGLGMDRSMSQAPAMGSFSQVQHHVVLSTPLSFGTLSLGNTTRLRLEPDAIWLSQSTVTLLVNKRWWWLSTENHTHFDLQHSTHRPLSLGKDSDLGIGTLRNALKLKSLWARYYEHTTHTVGVQAFATTHIRSAPSLSGLDTHLNPAARFNRRLSTGLTSSNDWSTLSTQLQLNAVHVGQSQYIDDHFAELDLKIEHAMAGLNATYAHHRSLLVNSTLSPSSAVSLSTTYFARRAGIIPMDLLFVDTTNGAPTIGHHVHWQTHDSRIRGSVWLPQDHRMAHAGALGWSQSPECECFRWTTELKYIRQMNNLWLTLQLELDLETSQRERTAP